MKNKSKRLINNTIIFFIGSLGSKFIQFFLVPLYTYVLTTEQYGVTEIVLTASNVLMPVFSLSIADGLLRFGLDKNWKKEDVLKTSLVIVFIGTICSILFIPVFASYDGLKHWMSYFLLILNFRIYRDVFAINLKINDKNLYFAIDSIIYTFALCGFSVLFLTILKMGIKGYFLSYVVANIVSIINLIIVGKPLRDLTNGKIHKSLLYDLIIYSIPMIANGIAWWVITASDRFILQYYEGASSVGIYSVASKIPTLISTFSSVFMQAWIISAVTEYDEDREKHFYSNVFHKYYVAMFVAATCLISVARIFMRFYVSPDFQIAWKYTPLLISGAIYSGMFGFFVGIYAAAKNSKSVTMTTVVGALINIVLNCAFIPIIEIQGAVIATYIAWLITTVIRIIDTRKILKFFIDYKKLAILMIINLIHCICTINLEIKYSLIISVIILGVIYSIEHLMINEILAQGKKILLNKIRLGK